MARIRNLAASTLALALLAAPAFAGDVPVFDEWNQPVMTQGAKGGRVQATAPGNFQIGVPRSSTAGGLVNEHYQGSQYWATQPDITSQVPTCGSQYLDRR